MRPLRGLLRGWRAFYGDNPLHLLSVIGCFALVGYVVSFVYESPSAIALAIWFGGAVLGHDLLLYPLYALADQPLTISRWARRKVLPRRPPRVPAINHIRVPVLGSAVLGIIYFPTITQRGESAFFFTAGLGTGAIYPNWLLITAILFLGSAVIYAARLGGSVGRTVVQRARRPAGVGAAASWDPEPAPEPAAVPVAVGAPEQPEAEVAAPGPEPALEQPAVEPNAGPEAAETGPDAEQPDSDEAEGSTAEPTEVAADEVAAAQPAEVEPTPTATSEADGAAVGDRDAPDTPAGPTG